MRLVVVNLEDPEQRSEVTLGIGEFVQVGRRPETLAGDDSKLLTIAWGDRLVSRQHCVATCVESGLQIERSPALAGRSKPNAFYTNQSLQSREVQEDPVVLRSGESVVIGARGTTALFCVGMNSRFEEILARHFSRQSSDEEDFETSEVKEQDYDEVEQLDEYSLRLQLRLLQQELPEQVLSGWTEEEELFRRAAVFLEGALPGQKGVSAAFLAVEDSEDGIAYTLLNPDPEARADFRPSRTLLSQLDLSETNPTDIHIWSSRENRRVFRAESLGEQIDWVAAIPVALLDESATIYKDEEGRSVFMYVVTRQATETAAASFIPFLRLISSLVASLLLAREEQKVQDRLATFFSPGLREVMMITDQRVLEPAMVDSTVIFVDRRGHSRMLEVAKTDEEILDRLEENQNVVSLITGEVFKREGVITDFTGDGALGLWGWPNVGDSEKRHALNAVEAAFSIVEKLEDRVQFEREVNVNMAAVRIGVSTGRMAVGKTGPSQQWHISVFGSVANLGARLERIAKEFRVPLLVSDETFRRVESEKRWRFRKLCFIRPLGFDESYPIYELIVSKQLGGSGADEEIVRTYERALDCFIRRDWDETLALLDDIPEDDSPSSWLREKAHIFREEPPPSEWAGEVQSFSK